MSEGTSRGVKAEAETMMAFYKPKGAILAGKHPLKQFAKNLASKIGQMLKRRTPYSPG